MLDTTGTDSTGGGTVDSTSGTSTDSTSTSGGGTGGTTAPTDSVTSGYGSGSTGGIEYESFEYDPAPGR